MPGFILTLSATVQCSHGGMAKPLSLAPNVLLGGSPVVTLPGGYSIATPPCALSTSTGPFCATGSFTTGATKVLAKGKPVAIVGGNSNCVATGNPLAVLKSQTKVKAS